MIKKLFGFLLTFMPYGQNAPQFSNIEAHWNNIEAPPKEIVAHRKNIDGLRKEIVAHRKNIVDNLKDLDGHRKEIVAHRKNIDGLRKEIVAHRKNIVDNLLKDPDGHRKGEIEGDRKPYRALPALG